MSIDINDKYFWEMILLRLTIQWLILNVDIIKKYYWQILILILLSLQWVALPGRKMTWDADTGDKIIVPNSSIFLGGKLGPRAGYAAFSSCQFPLWKIGPLKMWGPICRGWLWGAQFAWNPLEQGPIESILVKNMPLRSFYHFKMNPVTAT